jgi:predicted nuclease of predicted toxin-antitoxin system
MELRFLLDEDTESILASRLSKSGYDTERVVDVDELGRASTDAQIRDYAVETDRIIVTHDDDYLAFPVESHTGVFYVPNQRLSSHEVFRIVQSVAEAYDSRDEMQPIIFLTKDWL